MIEVTHLNMVVMKNFKYFAIALFVGVCAFGIYSCVDDHDEHDSNTTYYAGSADVYLTVTDTAGNPIEGVTLEQDNYDLYGVTDADGEFYIHLDVAPRSLLDVKLSHPDYETTTKTIAIGTVNRHDNKEVYETASMYPLDYIYTATLDIFDNSDFLAVEEACVQVVAKYVDGVEVELPLGEIDAAYADADGKAVLYLPAPDEGTTDSYDVSFTCEDYDPASGTISVSWSANAEKGEPWNTDCGTFTMKYIGEGKSTGPHDDEWEDDVEISYSDSDYDSGNYSYSVSKLTSAFGLSDDEYTEAFENGEITIVGVDQDGTEHGSNTNAYGCWWGEDQYVKNWGTDARVYLEGESYYSFVVGQYPGQCTKGETYPTCHKVSYTDEDGNTWSVSFKVNITVN